MSNPNYIELNCDNIRHLFDGNLVLIVTATDLETQAFHQLLKPLCDYDKIIKVFEGDLTYYLGTFGSYNVAHVQCSMGSISRDSSIMTVSTAIDTLNSKIVVMVGIAFGVDEQKQNIGDVLIAESIIPYDSKRIGKENTIRRGIEAPSSKILLNRFKNIKQTWEYFINDDIKAKLIPTRLLSGEELIDNIDYRNKLIQENPESRGGEMEGAGIYAACDSKADWIIIKGICDFADGAKGKDKEAKQTLAINSALSACLEIFNSPYAFKDLKVTPSSVDQRDTSQIDFKQNEALFDIYDINKEPYYIKRDIDGYFINTLNHFGIWIYGPVGCGKSNLILRNLIQGQRDFIQINLASCIDPGNDSFFREIYHEIYYTINNNIPIDQLCSFPEYNRAILNLLSTHYKNKELVVYIEEIPISSEDIYQDFSKKLFSLLISKSLNNGMDKIRFVLSSINNPTNFIDIFQQKIHEQLHFLSLEYWHNKDINILINIIEGEWNYELDNEIKNELVKFANGSPRFIKKFYRNICILNKTDCDTLQFLIKETQRELNQYKDA